MANPKVDPNLCIGCGLCIQLCPAVFELGDNGKSHVIKADGDSDENIQTAADSCPVSAISVD
ncbi:ferredoxin [Patescibacteria group bacterium]|nr:ferredoxin [Patescibacteria group bacterium]